MKKEYEKCVDASKIIESSFSLSPTIHPHQNNGYTLSKKYESFLYL